MRLPIRGSPGRAMESPGARERGTICHRTEAPRRSSIKIFSPLKERKKKKKRRTNHRSPAISAPSTNRLARKTILYPTILRNDHCYFTVFSFPGVPVTRAFPIDSSFRVNERDERHHSNATINIDEASRDPCRIPVVTWSRHCSSRLYILTRRFNTIFHSKSINRKEEKLKKKIFKPNLPRGVSFCCIGLSSLQCYRLCSRPPSSHTASFSSQNKSK